MPVCPGDPNFRPFVSGRPDVTSVRLDGSEEFCLLACDGFFDVVDPEESVRLVKEDIAEHPGTCGAGRLNRLLASEGGNGVLKDCGV